MSDWRAVCVLCAARGKQTRLETGHVCPPCLTRIGDDLTAIVELASWASVEPISGRGQGRTVPASKPPINVDGVDPALTMVTDCATVLDICEAWVRLVREARGMAPYGPASVAYAVKVDLERAKIKREGTRDAIKPRTSVNDTGVTLTGATTFLRASLPWWADSPDQPVEDFAGEIRACRRALAKWDPTREIGTMVKCPTMLEQGECGYRLYYHETDEHVTCRRCGASRDVATLIAVAMDSGGAHVWLDGEAITHVYAIPESQLRKWARRGWVKTSHGRYMLSSVIEARERQAQEGYSNLARRVAGA